MVAAHHVEVEGAPGLQAERVRALHRLPQPLALPQQQPRVADVQVDVGDQVLGSRLEPQRVPEDGQRLAVAADLVEQHAPLEIALSARIAARDLGRHLQRELVVAFAEMALAQPAQVGHRRALRKKQRGCGLRRGQGEGLDGGLRRRLHPYLGLRKYLIILARARA